MSVDRKVDSTTFLAPYRDLLQVKSTNTMRGCNSGSKICFVYLLQHKCMQLAPEYQNAVLVEQGYFAASVSITYKVKHMFLRKPELSMMLMIRNIALI